MPGHYDINDQTLALLRYKKTDMSILIETICPNVPNTVSHWRLLLVYLGIIEQTLGTLPIFGFLAATAGDGNKNKLCFKEKATYIIMTLFRSLYRNNLKVRLDTKKARS